MKSGRGGAGKGARGGKKQANQSTLDDYDEDMQLPQKGTSTPKFAENLQIKKGDDKQIIQSGKGNIPKSLQMQKVINTSPPLGKEANYEQEDERMIEVVEMGQNVKQNRTSGFQHSSSAAPIIYSNGADESTKKESDENASSPEKNGESKSKAGGKGTTTPHTLHTSTSSLGDKPRASPKILDDHHESLIAMFADNFCQCTGPNCKKELTAQFQQYMRSNLSRKFVVDLINIIAGSSSKSEKMINILIYFLRYLSLNNIGKDVQDDMLNLFVMIYLKASRALQRAIIEDLETIFFLIKEQETALFIDQHFKLKIFFQQLTQFQYCMKETAKKQATSAEPVKQCEIVAPAEVGSKKKYMFNSKSKMLINRNGAGEGPQQLPQQQQQQQKKNQATLSGKYCQIHGMCDIKEHTIDLTSTKEKFISYICLLAQLYFKILNIEDGHEDHKEVRRKYLCNLLFSILQNCEQQYYYYPLRALVEFFIEGESEKALGKRLTEENLLIYKHRKDYLGRTHLLQDFSKGVHSLSLQKLTGDQQSNGLTSISSGYSYLYADTLFELRKILSKLEQQAHLDCYLLCLKILSKIIREFKTSEYSQSAIGLYIDCLVAIGQKLFKLTVSEKEMYYSEVKNLIVIIKSKQQELSTISLQEEDLMDIDAGNKHRSPLHEERKDQAVYYQNVGGKFIPIVVPSGPSRSKSIGAFTRVSTDSATQQMSKFPNIAVLKHLINISAIQKYPRLALLVFDALLPFMEIFDNHLISFTDICQDQHLILKDLASAAESSDKSLLEVEALVKKIKLSEGASTGREVILNFFITSYHKNLLKKVAERQLQQSEILKDTGMTVQDYIGHLLKQRALLNKEEMIFIIDFLINLCKHCQIADNLAISLGSHLLPDLYDKTNKQIIQVVDRDQAELLYINFDLRFKYFMRKFSLYNRMVSHLNKMNQEHHWNQILPPIPEDDLFSSLFSKVYKRLTDKSPPAHSGQLKYTPLRERSMDVYTTHFLRTIIKILQQNRQYIKLDQVKSIVERIMYVGGSKLDVMANSWSLYFVISMFLNSYFTEIEGIISTFLETITEQLKKFKEEIPESNQTMLRFCQLRNLIYTYTSILRYLLCFQTPITDKTSSSQIYHHGHSQYNSQSGNVPYLSQNLGQNQSQQQVASQKGSTHGESPMKQSIYTTTSANDEDVSIIGQTNVTHEQSFIVKRQKRCNFCGEELPLPKKFTFQRKCKKCSLKNSTFIFPARFLCNSCVESNQNDLHRVDQDMIPLDNLRNAECLQSDLLMKRLQTLVARGLDLALKDQSDPEKQSLYFNADEACFKKLTSKENLYSQLVSYLLNRTLKVMRQLIMHDIMVDPGVLEMFNKLSENGARLTDSFMLTKNRLAELQPGVQLQRNRTMRRQQQMMSQGLINV